METLKNSRKKSILFFLVVSTLVIASSFSLTMYAEAAISSQEGIVMTEAELPRDFIINPVAFAGNSDLTITSQGTVIAQVMTAEQEAPFIKAAKEALANMNIMLNEDEYIVSGSYFADIKKVTISWLPSNWKNLGPFNNVTGEAYFVSFENSDIDAGVGTLSTVRSINGMQISIDAENVNTLRFNKLKISK